MAGEEIVIDINPDGSVTMEGENFVGPDCTALVAALEADLGDVVERTLKPEHHQRSITQGRKVGA